MLAKAKVLQAAPSLTANIIVGRSQPQWWMVHNVDLLMINEPASCLKSHVVVIIRIELAIEPVDT